MRSADIEIDGVYALVDYNHIAKVRVLEKGLPGSGYGPHRKNDGIRFEKVDATGPVSGRHPRAQHTTSRYLHPWEQRYDDRLREAKEDDERETEVETFATNEGLHSMRYTGGRVVMDWEDYLRLAELLNRFDR